jgi:hypothetical protein
MGMLVEYFATDDQDRQLDVLLKGYVIEEWFNPQDQYYVLESMDARVLTILCLFDIEIRVLTDDLEARDHPDHSDSN